MDRVERLQRRLKIARSEAADADRVWRAALRLAVPAEDDRSVAEAARRFHAVWQERERAHARVAVLEDALRLREDRQRFARLRDRASFVAWHVRGRLERRPTG